MFNITLVLKSKFNILLKAKGVTQKEFSAIIGEREPSISEFSNLKRSTININLLTKIARVLNLSSINEIFEFEYVFGLEEYKQEHFYQFQSNQNVKFAYTCNEQEQKFEIIEIVEDNILINTKYNLEGKTFEDIDRIYKSIEVHELVDTLYGEEKEIYMLVNICRYVGQNILTQRFKNRKILEDTIELLY